MEGLLGPKNKPVELCRVCAGDTVGGHAGRCSAALPVEPSGVPAEQVRAAHCDSGARTRKGAGDPGQERSM